MQCLRCHTENRDSVSYCEKCGSLLYRRRKSDRYRKARFGVSIALIIACLAGLLFFFHVKFFTSDKSSLTTDAINYNTEINRKTIKRNELSSRSAINKKTNIKSDAINSSLTQDLITPENPAIEKEVIAGWVIITDPWGRQVRKFRSGLAGNGWMALPTRACLGGSRWFFFPDSGEGVEILGGLWILGDRVGLWNLAKNAESGEGPGLGPWNEAEEVSWTSVESAVSYDSVKLMPGPIDGFFVSVSLPDEINEAGVFIQGGKVVGWSFGDIHAGGYMWPRKEGADMEYKTWVKYFYNITFANGREEQFARALAMSEESSSIDKLAAIVKGFRMRPKLRIEDTPQYLIPEEIIKEIRILLTDAVHTGKGNQVVNIFNSQLFKNIGDITLLIDMIPVISAAQGYSAAVNEIEDSGRYIARQLGNDVPALDILHVHLYQDWIQEDLDAGELDEGWQAYNSAKSFFPDDPYIHLLGVELVLLNGDWEEAERLLYMRNYPPELQDRFQILAGRISEMKGEEGKIVIRFTPGSSRIPVTAAINETVFQNFIVDTGASVITIPSSTAEALGLEIVQNKRTLWTASGVETVSEVVIDTIEIDGWVEHDVRALVLDMPDRQGLGLLGLNYLGRFRVDLKTEEGTLYLTPR